MSGDDPLAIIYSDAAFQEGKPISLGWVLFTPSSRPRAGAMEVPQALSEQFKERKTQFLLASFLGRSRLCTAAKPPSRGTEWFTLWTIRVHLRL